MVLLSVDRSGPLLQPIFVALFHYCLDRGYGLSRKLNLGISIYYGLCRMRWKNKPLVPGGH
jgi:hypothetical protein